MRKQYIWRKKENAASGRKNVKMRCYWEDLSFPLEFNADWCQHLQVPSSCTFQHIQDAGDEQTEPGHFHFCSSVTWCFYFPNVN